MRENGYHLGHIGKWHFTWTKRVSRTFHTAKPYYGDHWYQERFGGRIHVTAKNEKDSIQFLKKRPKGKPFILTTCFFAPHSVDGTEEQYFPQDEKHVAL